MDAIVARQDNHHKTLQTERLHCCDWEAATMLRAFPLAKKGEGRARLPSLYASFGKLGETPTHEDIIDNNRSINWPV